MICLNDSCDHVMQKKKKSALKWIAYAKHGCLGTALYSGSWHDENSSSASTVLKCVIFQYKRTNLNWWGPRHREFDRIVFSVVSGSTEKSSHHGSPGCHRHQWQLSAQFVNFSTKGQPKWHRCNLLVRWSSQDSEHTRHAHAAPQLTTHKLHNAKWKWEVKPTIRTFYAFESAVAARCGRCYSAFKLWR